MFLKRKERTNWNNRLQISMRRKTNSSTMLNQNELLKFSDLVYLTEAAEATQQQRASQHLEFHTADYTGVMT
jgi:hypothetical protein